MGAVIKLPVMDLAESGDAVKFAGQTLSVRCGPFPNRYSCDIHHSQFRHRPRAKKIRTLLPCLTLWTLFNASTLNSHHTSFGNRSEKTPHRISLTTESPL